jgi:nicotinic acid mononucleotide adenylyltransferase
MKASIMFGRFQPPTKAHWKLFQEVIGISYVDPSEHFIFISPTQDKKDNPLSLEFRKNFLSNLFKGINFIGDPEIKDPFDALCWLGKQGFDDIVLVCGQDRVEKYKNFLKYVNHPDPTKSIPNISFVSLPRSDGDISASKARQAIRDANIDVLYDNLINCDPVDFALIWSTIRRVYLNL